MHSILAKGTSSRGFTLVELLVVIAIIALLTSISFPVYRSVIAHGRIAKCSSNLRQIGITMLAFAGDNNGDLPESGSVIAYNALDSTTKQNGWCQQLEPYLSPGAGKGGAGTIFQCPDSSQVFPQNQAYSYFNGAHAAYAQTGGFAAVTLQKMHYASIQILAGDISFGAFTVDDADKDDYTTDPAFNGNATIPIHLGSSNILFADGHVENLKAFVPKTMTTVYDNNNISYLSP